MSEIPEPVTANDAYKLIIDHLVNEVRQYGTSSSITISGIFSKAPAHSKFNEFVTALSPTKRELLSRMLQDERDGAIHDLLSALSWWIDCRDVRLTYRGEIMPTSLSGTGLQGDFIGRRDGWEWPTGS
ncbi:MAG: hypothetical protein RL020_1624 [Pseudomonadota bacterium]|jgi:hypothetical protein